MSYDLIFGLAMGNFVGRSMCNMNHGVKLIPAHIDGLWTGIIVIILGLIVRWILILIGA